MSSKTHKQSVSELKLRRLVDHNQRLKDDLARPRVKVSEASQSLIRYTKTTRDPLVPSVWGPVSKNDDPYTAASPQQSGCCTIM